MIAENKLTEVPPVSRHNPSVTGEAMPLPTDKPVIADESLHDELSHLVASAKAEAAAQRHVPSDESRVRSLEKSGVRSTQTIHREIARHPVAVLVAAGAVGAAFGWFVKRSRWMAG